MVVAVVATVTLVAVLVAGSSYYLLSLFFKPLAWRILKNLL